jgi:hypothetical protein
MTWGDFPPSAASLGYAHDLSLIQVDDTGLGVNYRGSGNFITGRNQVYRYHAAASEVTGAHQFKVGFNYDRSTYPITQDTNTSHLFYNFDSGVPYSITTWATPYSSDSRVAETGIFAQDRWTIKHLTLSGAVRFDRVQTYFPAQSVGPSQYTPSRNLTIPNTDLLDWKDVTPRVGAAYDLFGNGKTAVKASAGKYLGREGAPGTYGAYANPLNTLAASTDRDWNDANGDFIPQCNLLNPAANGECGPIDNDKFGLPVPSLTFDPALVTGWGKRDYNWLFSTGVQHEVMPRMSVNLEYNYRSYGNQVLVVNRALAAADFTPFSIPAPPDPRLPSGGGYTVSNLYNVVPAKFGVTDNWLMSASNFGGLTERWQGIDAGTSIRPRNSLMIQGGISTGSTLYDNCAARAVHPDIAPTFLQSSGRYTYGGAVPNWLSPYCHVVTAWLLQAKGLARYTIPKVDVQFAAGFQSIPGPQILANYNAKNAVVRPSLGRPLSGGASTVSVLLVQPGTLYGDRLNQLDFRAGKVLKFGGRTRVNVNVDLFNALNSSAVVVQNNSFGAWQVPQQVLSPRRINFSAQLEF